MRRGILVVTNKVYLQIYVSSFHSFELHIIDTYNKIMLLCVRFVACKLNGDLNVEYDYTFCRAMYNTINLVINYPIYNCMLFYFT